MASLLRQIVAGPRAKHQETGLDLCYVTDDIIVTSGPSQTYPQRAYRNPLDRLVAFLDAKHGDDWAIWEFRAEGTGYPDEAVYGRIRHYPWPDHHPPPFRLIPMIMASMRNWLHGDDDDSAGSRAPKPKAGHSDNKVQRKGENDGGSKRVVVVHCKAGKGRSGTMACSYLISQCGWTPEAALAKFTEKRMRPQFGAGVSIPSQLRTISYVDRWTKGGKKYVDRQVEITEVHVWGLRRGVQVTLEGFADEGKKIKVLHTFTEKERYIVAGDAPGGGRVTDFPGDQVYEDAGDNIMGHPKGETMDLAEAAQASSDGETPSFTSSKSVQPLPDPSSSRPALSDTTEPGGMAVLLKPDSPVRIANSDIKVALERRNRTPAYMGLTMVTAVAHVWFNAFFEGNGPENDGKAEDSGVFDVEWEKMDGIKGSSRKGTKAADRISVVWRAVESQASAPGVVITEPGEGHPVPQMRPADWKGGDEEDPDKKRKLGLRAREPGSQSASKASSIQSQVAGSLAESTKESADGRDSDDESLKGVKSDLTPGNEPDLGSECGPVAAASHAHSGDGAARNLPEHDKKVKATEGHTEDPDKASGAVLSREKLAQASPSSLTGGDGHTAGGAQLLGQSSNLHQGDDTARAHA